ncbi:MAG: ArsR/SmtB family transcription factor [Candidatus Glassbacteria bacterium]
MNDHNTLFKNSIFDQFSRIGKALSNPRRLEILDLLSQCPRTVEALARESGMSIANTSQHLQLLRSAHLVRAEKKGLYVTYHLTSPDVREFYHRLRRFAESHLAEIDHLMRSYLDGKDYMEPVSREELIARVKAGTVTVIDVRPEEEYRAGHVSGAISVPLNDLERRLSELPTDKEIVAYCRGPFCLLAVNAVKLLRGKGFRAVRLDDGIHELKMKGLPITEAKEETT